jgi:DNA-binding MarR family transcriptional regulator
MDNPVSKYMNNEIQLTDLLRQINKEISRRLTPIFRQKKLSIAEISILMRINRKPACRATELATMIGIPTSTVTGMLDRLEKRGLLERRQDPRDRRSVLIAATSETREFVATLMTPMENMLHKAFRAMPDTRTRRLVQDLQFILRILEQENWAAG